MKGETSKAFFFLPFFKHDVSRVQESDLVTVAGDTEQVTQSLKNFLSVTVFGPSFFFIFNIIKKVSQYWNPFITFPGLQRSITPVRKCAHVALC